MTDQRPAARTRRAIPPLDVQNPPPFLDGKRASQYMFARWGVPAHPKTLDRWGVPFVRAGNRKMRAVSALDAKARSMLMGEAA